MLELLKSQLEILEDYFNENSDCMSSSELIAYIVFKLGLEQQIKEIENNE